MSVRSVLCSARYIAIDIALLGLDFIEYIAQRYAPISTHTIADLANAPKHQNAWEDWCREHSAFKCREHSSFEAEVRRIGSSETHPLKRVTRRTQPIPLMECGVGPTADCDIPPSPAVGQPIKTSYNMARPPVQKDSRSTHGHTSRSTRHNVEIQERDGQL